jgi:hypothetical protein
MNLQYVYCTCVFGYINRYLRKGLDLDVKFRMWLLTVKSNSRVSFWWLDIFLTAFSTKLLLFKIPLHANLPQILSPVHIVVERLTVILVLLPLLPSIDSSLFFPTADCRLCLIKTSVGWSMLSWSTTEVSSAYCVGTADNLSSPIACVEILPIEFFAHGGQQQRGQHRLIRSETSGRLFYCMPSGHFL